MSEEQSQLTPQFAVIALGVWMLGGAVLFVVGTWGTIRVLTNLQEIGLPWSLILALVCPFASVVGLRMVIDGFSHSTGEIA